jgi:hypothetical protein
MKSTFVITAIFLAALSANAGGLVSAGGGERLVFNCSSEKYQLSLIEDNGQLYADLVSTPQSNPRLVGKFAVSPLPSTGFTSSFASENSTVYLTAHYTNNAVDAVHIQTFGSLKNETIVCE